MSWLQDGPAITICADGIAKESANRGQHLDDRGEEDLAATAIKDKGAYGPVIGEGPEEDERSTKSHGLPPSHTKISFIIAEY